MTCFGFPTAHSQSKFASFALERIDYMHSDFVTTMYYYVSQTDNQHKRVLLHCFLSECIALGDEYSRFFKCSSCDPLKPYIGFLLFQIQIKPKKRKETSSYECAFLEEKDAFYLCIHTRACHPSVFPSWLSNLNANVPKSDSTKDAEAKSFDAAMNYIF